MKVQQQNETITMLQRRIALEAKNFRHQLQNEISKHKDTRHDLDMAITNADKLTTIIEVNVFSSFYHLSSLTWTLEQGCHKVDVSVCPSGYGVIALERIARFQCSSFCVKSQLLSVLRHVW